MNQLLDYMQVERNIVIWQWQAGQLVVELKSEAIHRDTDKSQYFAITEFNSCFIIWSPSLFSYLSHSQAAQGSDLPFEIFHLTACFQFHVTNGTFPEQIITCRQLFENYMVVSWPMKRKGKLHQMIINITFTPLVMTTFPQQPLLFHLPTIAHSSKWLVKCVSRFDCIIISLHHHTGKVMVLLHSMGVAVLYGSHSIEFFHKAVKVESWFLA